MKNFIFCVVVYLKPGYPQFKKFLAGFIAPFEGNAAFMFNECPPSLATGIVLAGTEARAMKFNTQEEAKAAAAELARLAPEPLYTALYVCLDDDPNDHAKNAR